MALFQNGTFEDFVNQLLMDAEAERSTLGATSLVAAMAAAPGPARAPNPSLDLEISSERHGLTLKEIELTKDFEVYFPKVFGGTQHEVFFLAWSYDLSSNPVFTYPGEKASASSCLLKMRVGKLKTFMGDGALLFPPRRVTGGLTTRITLWESDAEERAFASTMQEISKKIQDSELNKLLSAALTLSGGQGKVLNQAKDASLELANIIGEVLKQNGDDYVDFYEGFFSASKTWKGEETHEQENSKITLTHLA